MKKFLLFLLLLLAVLAAAAGYIVYTTPPPPVRRVLPPPPETKAVAAAVIHANTGKIYGEKNGGLKIYPASTTKILTCILALEEGHALLDGDAVITPRAMEADGTSLGLRTDTPISLREVLYGMMLVSGNDAAVAVAETVGGSYERFIEMMNEKTASVGVSHSHFANPNGLTDPAHYTTACDMVKLSAYAMRNPEFQAIVREAEHSMVYRDGTIRIIENRNEFLGSGYAGANGVKTGMTEAAGDCLVASADHDGDLMIVGVYNDDDRWEDVKVWLDYGFAALAADREYEAALAAEPALDHWINETLRGYKYE